MQGNRKPRPAEPTATITTPVVTSSEILTVAEVAALLKVPVSSIYEWCRFRSTPAHTNPTSEGWQIPQVPSVRSRGMACSGFRRQRTPGGAKYAQAGRAGRRCACSRCARQDATERTSSVSATWPDNIAPVSPVQSRFLREGYAFHL